MTEAVVQVRVKVLSSQLQNAQFRLKFVVTQRLAPCEPPTVISVESESIKSVAKRDQIKRLRAQQEHPGVPLPKRKRASGVEILEALEEIKTAQKNQQRLLQTICDSDTTNKEKPTLEEAFTNFLNAYIDTDENERPKKLRKLVNSRSRDMHFLREISDSFSLEQNTSIPLDDTDGCGDLIMPFSTLGDTSAFESDLSLEDLLALNSL
eukprot:CAMPEP_0168525370 /NCGR_PEP_ID=MMETSP0405-20121227/11254_1 /TAXON_ID=498012 /ORGANISM="Trichosphaerium sp, Strain Am-I-7 wt" /LENGTH=207 /DNA_ID=CAMNT_0008547853 /DNA_START=306 /DNA_END=929 /DNA_ORIENTATION=-